MLIFISDLHFIDETAGAHNIPPGAFRGVSNDIKNYAGNPSEVKVVFLGDIFDLIRTTQWLDVHEDERPWGDIVGKADRIEANALKIMDDLLSREYNSKTFAFLKNGLDNAFGRKVERIYIPGNHDRLCNIYPSLRKKVRDALGITGGDEPFAHYCEDKAYGVYALHGHEFDEWNYEGTANRSESDYNQVPIGDLIACEIISRIPYTIMKNVPPSMPRENLKQNLQEIDNIRPFSAIFKWLFYQVRESRQLQQIIDGSLRQIAENFDSLQFLPKWYRRHDKFLSFDMADEMQALVKVFEHFNINAAEDLIKIYSRIFGASNSPDSSDEGLNKAATAFLSRTSDYNYLVMGHTHNPLQMPVRVTSEGEEQIYINTGTWRKKFAQGTSGGFVGLKYLTYAVFYNRAENPKQCFETWTGALQE